jgi:polyhydroxyalkanoate synthesis repressor PhaR
MASSRPSASASVSADAHAAPAVIKKYANRRLYNTESSSYITLEHLAQLVRDGREFVVHDARTGEDITRQVLTQIIMEQEGTDGAALLPVSFLRELIGLYGNSMQSLVPHYLEASMEAMKRNQEQMRAAMAGAFAGTPFEALARQNMDLFAKAAEMWAPKRAPAAPGVAVEPVAGGGADDEMARIKAQMAALQAQLERMGRA